MASGVGRRPGANDTVPFLGAVSVPTATAARLVDYRWPPELDGSNPDWRSRGKRCSPAGVEFILRLGHRQNRGAEDARVEIQSRLRLPARRPALPDPGLLGAVDPEATRSELQ
jgi:hypothetical protein